MLLAYPGELYDVMDMYDSEEAQARLDRMDANQLFTHLALQGECSTPEPWRPQTEATMYAKADSGNQCAAVHLGYAV